MIRHLITTKKLHLETQSGFTNDNKNKKGGLKSSRFQRTTANLSKNSIHMEHSW